MFKKTETSNEKLKKRGKWDNNNIGSEKKGKKYEVEKKERLR